MLISFARHWGTYGSPLDKQRKQFSSLYEATYTPRWAKGWSASLALGMDRGNYLPLDKQRKQFSSLYEATYTPRWAKGWSASLALGMDRGNYLGNTTGGMLVIRKTGVLF